MGNILTLKIVFVLRRYFFRTYTITYYFFSFVFFSHIAIENMKKQMTFSIEKSFLLSKSVILRHFF